MERRPTSVALPRALRRARSIDDLRALARRRLPRAIFDFFDFFDGAAEDEVTMRENRAAFERIRLLPRMLVDVSRPDLTTPILGLPSRLPLMIAPTGAAGYGRPGGDVAIARAAADAGIPYVLSSSATASIERVAREAPGHLWFQAYIFRQRDYTLKLIARARDAGYEALVITVDLPVGGKRERDFRNDFAVPFRYTPRNLLDFASRPAWALRILRSGLPMMESLDDFVPDNTSAVAAASSVGRNYDASFDWEGLAAIRDAWPRKLVIKGVLHPGDAERAVRIGCDGVCVSNHGGRQLDGAVATLDALPGMVAAVGERAEVFLDGGIRRGSSILKALALGARAVLIGRPTLYGVSAAGQAGARRAIAILEDELQRVMQLCGTPTISAIDHDILAGPGPRADGNVEAVAR